MIKVRMRDLALVAVAGGLLAFELVSIGEALPEVKKALVERGWSPKALVASASAEKAPAIETSAAVETPAAPVCKVAVATATRHAHRVAAATSSATAKRCIMVTRAKKGQSARGRVRVVTMKSEGSFAYTTLAHSREELKEVQKAVDLALKHSTL